MLAWMDKLGHDEYDDDDGNDNHYDGDDDDRNDNLYDGDDDDNDVTKS